LMFSVVVVTIGDASGQFEEGMLTVFYRACHIVYICWRRFKKLMCSRFRDVMVSSRSVLLCVRSIHTSCRMNKRGPLTIDGWYPRDHMPDDYPKNEEERRAAAIKYGMRLEDYKPYDKDDCYKYAGNYPDYGCVTYDHKDPYENWSDPHYRRNWGEGVSYIRHGCLQILFTEILFTIFLWTNTVIFCRHLIPALIFCWIGIQTWPKGRKWKNDIMLKQYPYDIKRAYPFTDPRIYPITNYTFEPGDQ
uniref:NADH dehydrogenase [ubiquinone] 1 beta subcomplex subunit 8, mitochondrial n=1 Tax=Brugia timori TaxID=42155 RepID=A0A0R3QQS8_9BILA